MNSVHYCHLVLYKSYADLKAEATRAYLGFLWWFLEPVMYMAVFYLIFETGLRSGKEGFVEFLLCGLIVWKWFSSTVMAASSTLTKNANIIQQVYIPKFILPLVPVVSNMVKFSIILIIYLAVLPIIFGHTPTLTWLFIPVLILLELLLIACCGLFVASLVPFAQDVKLLLDNLMVMLFFISGIFFDLSHMPERVQTVLGLNPVALIIDAYRGVILRGEIPGINAMVYVFAFSLVFGTIGLSILNRFDRVYPKIVSK